MPHPLEIPSILVDKSTQPYTEIEVLQPYFPAHELFGCMHTHYLPEFEKRILGVGDPTGSFTEYWRDADVENDPRLKHHPLRSKPDYKTKCVPCARHGDGVPYKKGLKGGSLDVAQWSSLAGYGSSTWDTRFFTWGIPGDCYTAQSREVMLRVEKWDWECGLSGRYSSKSPFEIPWLANSARGQRAGTLLTPDGKFLGLVLGRSDWDYLNKFCGFPHWRSHEMCRFCPANRSDKPWTEFRQAESGWMGLMLTLEAYY